MPGHTDRVKNIYKGVAILREDAKEEIQSKTYYVMWTAQFMFFHRQYRTGNEEATTTSSRYAYAKICTSTYRE